MFVEHNVCIPSGESVCVSIFQPCLSELLQQCMQPHLKALEVLRGLHEHNTRPRGSSAQLCSANCPLSCLPPYSCLSYMVSQDEVS